MSLMTYLYQVEEYINLSSRIGLPSIRYYQIIQGYEEKIWFVSRLMLSIVKAYFAGK